MKLEKARLGRKGKALSRRTMKFLSEKPEKVLSSDETKNLVRDLETYQIELELQNEELRKAQELIEASRSKYADLYDFAPIGYFTLDESWLIQEVNLTGAALLGMQRANLMHKPFFSFVNPAFRDTLYFHRQKVLEGRLRQTCELMLVRKDGREFYATMESIAEKGNRSIRSAFFDITEKKLAEDRVHQLSAQLMTAQEIERKRIAHEIHDSLASTLSALKYRLESKIQKIKKGDSLSIAVLEEMIITLQGTIDQVLRIMNTLRPSILDDLGLLPTLNWFFREYENTYSHIEIQKQIEIQEAEIPDPLKIVIFRVLQEALNNFAKYGQGNRVRLSLENRGGKIQLTFQDNGQGFDSQGPGLDLDSIRKRLEFSGGVFDIESARETGTTIRASWPRASELA